MKKIIRKLSLSTQIILINTLLLSLSLILYFVYINLLDNTSVYNNNPTLFNILYWLIIIIALMIITSFAIEKITLPAKEFIGYAKEFQKINFNVIADEMTNSDFIKLANAFNELQKTLDEAIEKLSKKNTEILTLNENLKN